MSKATAPHVTSVMAMPAIKPAVSPLCRSFRQEAQSVSFTAPIGVSQCSHLTGASPLPHAINAVAPWPMLSRRTCRKPHEDAPCAPDTYPAPCGIGALTRANVPDTHTSFQFPFSSRKSSVGEHVSRLSAFTVVADIYQSALL